MMRPLFLAAMVLSSSLAQQGCANDHDIVKVQLTGSGTGRVTSDGGFIDCPGVCSHDFPVTNPVMGPQAEIGLTATPLGTSIFGGWSGSCSGQVPIVAVTLVANGTVICTARFDLGVGTSGSLAGTWTLYDNPTTLHSPFETTTIPVFSGTAFTGTNTVSGTITRDLTGSFTSATALSWTRWENPAHTQCSEKETLTADFSASPNTLTGNIIDCSTGTTGRAVLWKHN